MKGMLILLCGVISNESEGKKTLGRTHYQTDGTRRPIACSFMSRGFLLLVTFVGLASPCAWAQPLPPVDESALGPGFLAFRAGLMKAIENRDAKFVRAITTTSTTFHYGVGGRGYDGLQSLGLNSQMSASWGNLAWPIKLGGTWNSQLQTMTFPYLIERWPRHERGDNGYAAVIGRDVNLRQGSSPYSVISGSLSYEVVKLDPNRVLANSGFSDRVLMENEWVPVLSSSGQSGYVASRFLYSPFGFRVVFKKVDSRWLLDSFVRGD